MMKTRSATAASLASPGSTRRRIRSRAAGVLAACAVTAGIGVVSATAASAALPPVTYSRAYNSCTTVQNGNNTVGYMDGSRPIDATHYTGTTYLYWVGQVQVAANGQWYNLESGGGAYAHIWGFSGNQLTPIYWADAPNNYGFSFVLPVGHSYRVVGVTSWWNGHSWFTSDRTVVVGCNF